MYGHEKSGVAGGDSAAEQTDPLDFSCGSNGSELGGYDPAAAAAKVVHSYTFGRPLHSEYSTERSLYYRDSLGKFLLRFISDFITDSFIHSPSQLNSFISLIIRS